MNKYIFFYIFLLKIQSLFVASQNLPDLVEYRLVRQSTFKDKKYDVVEYQWNITGSKKTGMFSYYVYSEMGVCTLLMNSTEYERWTTTEYNLWLKSTNYDFNFLSNDLETYMCMSPVARCEKSLVRFPGKELHMVVIPRPENFGTSYAIYDKVNLNNTNAATLLYDPVDGYISTATDKQNTTTTLIEPPTPVTTINTSKATETVADNMNDTKEEEDNTVLYIIIGCLSLLVVLIVAAILLFCLKRRNNKKALLAAAEAEETKEATSSKKMPIGYVPHHTMKRVAYRYTCSTVTLERNDIVELIERYNDGWVKVINPIDSQEYIIPLIILEGDSEDDLTNIPLGENNEQRLLSTPENLYESKLISQEDCDEMKRNDDWIKKVRLMKRSKPESLREGSASIENIRFKDETSSIKNNPHHFQRPLVEANISIENSIPMNEEMKEKRKAIKSMVATLELENSNTELLMADHVLEVYNEEDEDEEEEIEERDIEEKKMKSMK